MESKFWLYAYIILGGAVLFAGGYYLGLSWAPRYYLTGSKILSWPLLGPSGAILNLPGALLGPSWGRLGSS